MRDFRWPPPPDGGPRTYGPGPSAPRSGRPTLPEPETEIVATPHGVRLERLITGTGRPTTVFAHGLASGIAVTRPLGSAVDGRKVFFQFRGHGRSDAPPGPWSYADLARDLRAIADSPDRFDRLVFFLPAVLDLPRPAPVKARLAALADAVGAGDVAAVADAISVEIPPNLRGTPAVWAYLRQRIDQLMRDGLAADLASLAEQVAIADPAPLGRVTARTLVIGCTGDELHPVAVAERLAEALPNATLHVYDRPGVVWTDRADLRTRISDFLNAPE